MPFLAEDIYQRLKGPLESVHMESWPRASKVDKKVLDNMNEVRRISSLALEARTKAKIIVRQPLSKLSVKTKLPNTHIDIIKDEVNVKEVAIDPSITEEVMLDTNITPELKEEGIVRELIRAIQDLRKESGLTIQDRVSLVIDADMSLRDLITKNTDVIKNTTLLTGITFNTLTSEVIKIAEYTIRLGIQR